MQIRCNNEPSLPRPRVEFPEVPAASDAMGAVHGSLRHVRGRLGGRGRGYPGRDRFPG